MSDPGALGRLRAALAEARDIYDGRDKTPAGENGPIAGVVNGIHALNEYLGEVGIPQCDRDPLLVLNAAFRDHARGKPHPLFAVTKKEGHRAHSTDNMWRAAVAAAVQLLQQAGTKKPEAIAIVAERIGVKASTVDSWHRQISTERHTDKGAIQTYKTTLAEAAEVHPEAPAKAAQQLLDGLADQKL